MNDPQWYQLYIAYIAKDQYYLGALLIMKASSSHDLLMIPVFLGVLMYMETSESFHRTSCIVHFYKLYTLYGFLG